MATPPVPLIDGYRFQSGTFDAVGAGGVHIVMQSKNFIFFVSETEYKELQAVCPGDFPFTYSQFVARVDQGIKTMGNTATTGANVNSGVQPPQVIA